MSNINRRQHSAALKTQVVLSLLREEQTRAEICSQFNIHPTQAAKWKQKALAGLPKLFSDTQGRQAVDQQKLIDRLYAQIGRLQVELDFLKKNIGLVGRSGSATD